MTPRVFLCEPSVLSPEQRRLSDQWHERLYGYGFDVDQIRKRDYQPNPWPQLLGRLQEAQGVLVLGFAQLRVKSGTWRSGTAEMAALVATWTSPWLQVEAGVGLASELPVLVAPDAGVAEGVFASESWVGELRGTPVASPDETVVDEWAGAVIGRLVSDEYLRKHP